MEKEFVSYEQAKALRELGFNFLCVAFWSNIVNNKATKIYTIRMGLESSTKEIKGINYTGFLSAPLKQQAFKFFMEKYNLRGFIGFRPNVKKFDYHIYDMSLSGEEYVKQRTMKEFNKDPKVGTYEEAENACIDKLLVLAKQQDNGN